MYEINSVMIIYYHNIMAMQKMAGCSCLFCPIDDRGMYGTHFNAAAICSTDNYRLETFSTTISPFQSMKHKLMKSTQQSGFR